MLGPVLREAARQQHGAHAELRRGGRALVIEPARGADGRGAEREHDGRLAGREELLELRLERLGFVVEHGARRP